MGLYPLETGQQFLEILEKYNIKDLDTAFAYVRAQMRITLCNLV